MRRQTIQDQRLPTGVMNKLLPFYSFVFLRLIATICVKARLLLKFFRCSDDLAPDHRSDTDIDPKSPMKSAQPPLPRSDELELGVKKILSALRGLKFGSVEITVHEGRIVQIERKEKFRLSLNLPDTVNSGNP